MIELRVLTGSCVLELKYAAEKLLVREGEVVELVINDGLQITPPSNKSHVPCSKDICRQWCDRVKLLLSVQKY